MNIWIHDIELAPNFFSVTILDYNSDRYIVFEISQRKNDIKALYDFYKGQPMYLVGFNSKSFDDMIINYIIKNYWKIKYYHYDELLMFINEISNLYFDTQNDDTPVIIRKYTKQPDHIIQVDLMKYWSILTIKSKQMSLKALGVQMGHEWIQDLPFKPGEDIPLESFDDVLRYNKNDCDITKKLAKEYLKDDINLRHSVYKQYGINAFSRDGVNMGCDILLKTYCEQANKDMYLTKKSGTIRNEIHLKDIIFDDIKFKELKTGKCQYEGDRYVCSNFNDLLQHLKNRTVTSTRELKYTVFFKGMKIDYGSGGIHGMWDGHIVESDDEYLIFDADVGSMYPSITISRGLYPEHLGPEFVEVYEDIKISRMKAKKLSGKKSTLPPEEKKLYKLESDTLKLSLNGAYGNYNNQYSWLYDMNMTLKTTINGQLMLSMLIEDLSEVGIWCFTCNTDGITCKVPKDKVDDYYRTCSEWEKKIGLELEYQEYVKIIQKNVNNYIWIRKDKNNNLIGKPKGLFAFYRCKDYPNVDNYKVLGDSNDFEVISKALYEYYVNGTDYREFILNHKNILDFCAAKKVSKKYDYVWWRGKKQNFLNRYYVSKNGANIYKQKKNHNMTNVIKGFPVELYNMHEDKPIKDYNIYYSYYISEVRKIISSMNPIGQLTLF